MSKRDRIAVWLSDGYARLLLGQPANQQPSRWLVVGDRHEEYGAGLWVATEYAEERKSDNNRVRYTVSPPMCLLRWDSIITIQQLKKGEQEIGIQTKEG
jgi:hypothetical protein